ncbi:MAG TPA: PIN domain-containing protein [Spirochaetota bacterium]|nr:PIN domain-containing protein [Spirochaetota bacterium]HPJ44029.1 PIN domain-containing protein [Spirochaetota bacterium]HPR39176.1 PIN domain-containing protein [Spirochaetota bacterium]HRX49127.1 PIN domain-containing protein [Spirochaetota bacterium]
MIFYLDTNIISYILKNKIQVIDRMHEEIAKGNMFKIPAISYYEICRGLHVIQNIDKLNIFRKICNDMGLADITKNTLDIASEIYAELRTKGELIEDADIIIAASCIENNSVLVTNNEMHFKRIPDLKYENWI